MFVPGNKLVSECGKEFKMPAPKMLKPPNDMVRIKPVVK